MINGLFYISTAIQYLINVCQVSPSATGIFYYVFFELVKIIAIIVSLVGFILHLKRERLYDGLNEQLTDSERGANNTAQRR